MLNGVLATGAEEPVALAPKTGDSDSESDSDSDSDPESESESESEGTDGHTRKRRLCGYKLHRAETRVECLARKAYRSFPKIPANLPILSIFSVFGRLVSLG
jgi:hypothetical protein